jgi:hypothetical protein
MMLRSMYTSLYIWSACDDHDAPRPATSETVSQISLPGDALTLSTLPRIDYEDAFVVASDVTRTAEQWVRAVALDAPRSVRARLYLGWTSLGLKLGPPAPRS